MNSQGVLSVCEREIDDGERMQWMNEKWGEKEDAKRPIEYEMKRENVY